MKGDAELKKEKNPNISPHIECNVLISVKETRTALAGPCMNTTCWTQAAIVHYMIFLIFPHQLQPPSWLGGTTVLQS